MVLLPYVPFDKKEPYRLEIIGFVIAKTYSDAISLDDIEDWRSAGKEVVEKVRNMFDPDLRSMQELERSLFQVTTESFKQSGENALHMPRNFDGLFLKEDAAANKVSKADWEQADFKRDNSSSVSSSRRDIAPDFDLLVKCGLGQVKEVVMDSSQSLTTQDVLLKTISRACYGQAMTTLAGQKRSIEALFREGLAKGMIAYAKDSTAQQSSSSSMEDLQSELTLWHTRRVEKYQEGVKKHKDSLEKILGEAFTIVEKLDCSTYTGFLDCYRSSMAAIAKEAQDVYKPGSTNSQQGLINLPYGGPASETGRFLEIASKVCDTMVNRVERCLAAENAIGSARLYNLKECVINNLAEAVSNWAAGSGSLSLKFGDQTESLQFSDTRARKIFGGAMARFVLERLELAFSSYSNSFAAHISSLDTKSISSTVLRWFFEDGLHSALWSILAEATGTNLIVVDSSKSYHAYSADRDRHEAVRAPVGLIRYQDRTGTFECFQFYSTQDARLDEDETQYTTREHLRNRGIAVSKWETNEYVTLPKSKSRDDN